MFVTTMNVALTTMLIILKDYITFKQNVAAVCIRSIMVNYTGHYLDIAKSGMC